MHIIRYKLSCNLTLTKETCHGPEGGPLQAENPAHVALITNPDVTLWWRSDGQERLTITEDITLGALDFMGAMRVLGELHQALTEIRGGA